jgi:hypothetical protein
MQLEKTLFFVKLKLNQGIAIREVLLAKTGKELILDTVFELM